MSQPVAGRNLPLLSWPQVPLAATLLVPLVVTEQHGPHLPTGTDAFVATAVVSAVATSLADGSAEDGSSVVVAPTFGYGASGEHEQFSGTLSIGHEALALLLVELGRSASRWARRVLVVNARRR